MLSPITGSNIVTYYNGSAWVCITPVNAVIATSETTASASYTALTTPGPIVTINTGTKALISVGASMENNTANGGANMGVAISGATTLAAADTAAAFMASTTPVVRVQASYTFQFSALTAGSNVFTAQYKATTAGTATFVNRSLTVVAIP